MIIGPCTIMTGGPKPAVIERAGVRVVGSHIGQIGPVGNLAAAYPDETLWPARGRVLMPGFVNTHAHLTRHLARGLGLRTPAEWRRYERSLTPEDARWATAAALVEGVRHGVTTVCDFHRTRTPREPTLRESIDAAIEVGVRMATCYGAAEDDSAEERKAALDECERIATAIHKKRQGKLNCMVGVQASTLAGLDTLYDEAAACAGEQLSVHVDLTLDLTPSELLRARQKTRTHAPSSLWAHAESAPRGLLSEARERGDLLCAVGSGSVAALVREAEVAWGSDSGANAPPLPDTNHGWGLRAEAHFHRLFVAGPAWASRYFGHGLGEIAPGAPADLVLVDYRPATDLTARTLVEHLWSGMLRAPVSGVMVSGEVVMDNGVMVSVDEREVATHARECAKRVWQRLA